MRAVKLLEVLACTVLVAGVASWAQAQSSASLDIFLQKNCAGPADSLDLVLGVCEPYDFVWREGSEITGITEIVIMSVKLNSVRCDNPDRVVVLGYPRAGCQGDSRTFFQIQVNGGSISPSLCATVNTASAEGDPFLFSVKTTDYACSDVPSPTPGPPPPDPSREPMIPPTPVPTRSPTPRPTETPGPTVPPPEPTATPSPTPSPSPSPTPPASPTPSPVPTPEPTESSSPSPDPTEASTPTSSPSPSPSPVPTPSPTPICVDAEWIEARGLLKVHSSDGVGELLCISGLDDLPCGTPDHVLELNDVMLGTHLRTYADVCSERVCTTKIGRYNGVRHSDASRMPSQGGYRVTTVSHRGTTWSGIENRLVVAALKSNSRLFSSALEYLQLRNSSP
ncbi:Cell surface glycoprotein 1 [Porphyridium purpureum]|uniref:Cell surface glycoprotein 1 n=1 Tax=Porphyridium purpureum TaxID=35688 RepID=A0A5J4Z403_PORPP|nr:Cell surface glycoprotein 1 [Porphyridium purpureum]|eukprot:POR0701..scf295_1